MLLLLVDLPNDIFLYAKVSNKRIIGFIRLFVNNLHYIAKKKLTFAKSTNLAANRASKIITVIKSNDSML